MLNINYDEKKNILDAKGKVKIEDKIEDYILSLIILIMIEIHRKFLQKVRQGRL